MRVTYFMLASALAGLARAAAAEKPNIVLIITDDQDVLSLSHPRFLPKINKHLVGEGLFYDNFFAPVSVCCPSRVSLLRTQLAHNHNITFVSQPWGGWEVFNRYGYVGSTLPDFLQTAGYDTYYTGKLMNDHTAKNCESLPVSGFNSSDFLVDPYTYDYWNPGFSRDNGPVKLHPGEYSTDLIRDKAVEYLEDAIKDTGETGRPFFLGIAPIAPHSWLISGERRDEKMDNNTKMQSHIPPGHPRHATLFSTEQLPRTVSWNPDYTTGVSWVRNLPKLNATNEAYLDEFYRGRLRALQAVDELVEDVVETLKKAGQLDNTYIFYTADNGFALGSHRRQPGKTLGFEEDIHVPLIVRGPGIPKGYRDATSSYGIVDLSKTILDIAGGKPTYEDDGTAIDLHQAREVEQDLLVKGGVSRHSISEYWVLGVEEGIYAGTFHPNNTYRTLRVHDTIDGQNLTYSYSVWCTGERELYDLQEDPHQVRNLLEPLNKLGSFVPFDYISVASGQPALSADVIRLGHRLDALLLVLKNCKGDTCTNPYQALSTKGNFKRLADVLPHSGRHVEHHLDHWFASLPKVQFSTCALGYQARLEKPEWDASLAYGKDAQSFVVQN